MTSKIIRERESRAKKGELLSMYELYMAYKEGLDVEADKDLAEHYFKECFNYLEDGYTPDNKIFKSRNQFFLKEIKLKDFRRFEALDVSFEDDLTVLIGSNGQGKTTIIDAISKTLSWINASLKKEDGLSGVQKTLDSDVNNNSEDGFTDVHSEFFFGKGLNRIQARLSKAKQGNDQKRDNQIQELRQVANLWREINTDFTINLPLFAFYAVERSFPPEKLRGNNSSIRDNRFDAYDDVLKGAGQFENFIGWYKRLNKRIAGSKSESQDVIGQLEAEVKGLLLSVNNGVQSLQPLLENKQQQLFKLQEQKNIASDLRSIELINAVICRTVPKISKIWFDDSSGDDLILLENDGVIVQLKQLSDGQRTYVALIADIARRMILLNPNLKNPLHGQGIVLIDEIELHLHPKWQQGVIINLQKAFPNIQFIMTTHSPQVLSTVDKRCIRKFEPDENGNTRIVRPEFQTKGVMSSDILERIMGTVATPNIPEAKNVEHFSELLSLNKKEEAENLLKDTLIPHFGENHPVILDCLNLIKIFEMKLRLNDSQNKM